MFGTSEEAKAMLEKAVAAVKQDKAKALDMFNKGEGGFKDRDLYVFCANASDGIMTAHPYGYKGKQLREIFGKKGYPFGQEIMEKATEGEIKEVSYWWPRPGSDDQVHLLHEGGRSNLWGRLLPRPMTAGALAPSSRRSITRQLSASLRCKSVCWSLALGLRAAWLARGLRAQIG